MAKDAGNERKPSGRAEAPTKQQPVCFVISLIGTPGEPGHTRAAKVLRHVIRKALEPKYCVVRADEIDDPGRITKQIFELLVSADLVVADLTDHNGNVMYELAVRHLLRKPYIQLIDRGQRLPFDIAQMRTIHFTLDPDDIEEAQQKIRDQEAAIVAGTLEIESPLSEAVDLRTLGGSGEARDRVLHDLANEMTRVRAELASLSANVRSRYTVNIGEPLAPAMASAFRFGLQAGEGVRIVRGGEATGGIPSAERFGTPGVITTPAGVAITQADPLR